MRRFLLAAMIFFGCGEVLACSCMVEPVFDPATYIRNADVIFIGRVEKLHTAWQPVPGRPGSVYVVEPWGPNSGTAVSFQVGRPLKGTADRVISLYTGQGGGDCGFTFMTGLTYLVFARYDEYGTLITHICSGTGWLGQAYERQRFEALIGDYRFDDPEPYEARTPGVTPPVLIGPRVPEIGPIDSFPVAMTIDREGRVASFAFADGTTRCFACCAEKRAALARQVPAWRFQPALLEGKPVSVIRNLSRIEVKTTDEDVAYEKRRREMELNRFNAPPRK
jgi:hypothetical protein